MAGKLQVDSCGTCMLARLASARRQRLNHVRSAGMVDWRVWNRGSGAWLPQRLRGEHLAEVCHRSSVLKNAQTDLSHSMPDLPGFAGASRDGQFSIDVL